MTDHETHCQNCFNVKQCLKEKSSKNKSSIEIDTGCEIIKCRLQCCFQFHTCKLEEHELLCPRAFVPCINVEYGCPMRLERRNQAVHLITCPASVVVCTVEWNRKPLPPWQRQPFPFQPNHLDVAAVNVDQRTVAEYKESLPSSLRSLLKTDNRKRPIMPLGVAGNRIPNSILIQAKIEKDALGGVSDDEDFSFSETPGGSKKSPPGLQESVCNKLKELSLAPAPSFRISSPDSGAMNGHSSKSDISDDLISSAALSNSSSSVLEDIPPEEPKPSCENLLEKRKVDALSLIVDVTSKGACKYMNLYSFMCAKEFRRDEYSNHFKSVHNEILTQLNGWLFARCPLANYGCNFGVERMFPMLSSKDENQYHVVYNSDIGSFCFTQIYDQESGTNEHSMSLCDLPVELLLHLTRYLDPLSLNALSMTNTHLRSVCQLVVVDRGIVVFDWEKNLETGNWEVAGKKWIFSTAFSPLRTWKFADVGVIANHMQKCSHFDELRHRPDRPFCYPVREEEL